MKTADTYQSITLKWKLIRHLGSRVSILDQSIGLGFICASDIPLGDALDKLRRLENEYNVDQHQATLYRAARILRENAKACKKKSCDSVTTEESLDSASKMAPDSFLNFAACLMSDKVQCPPVNGTFRIMVDRTTREKALMVSQHLLQQIASVITPLAILPPA